ncbi:hypothetical protein ACHQM5_008177 [Ranunculus cassubicifolius]
MNSAFSITLFSFTITLLSPLIFGQLSPPEARILLQLQENLEYPAVLQGWNNWTNFCYLPPSASLTILCSGNHITQLTIIGSNTSSHKTLSEKFSIDSFFTKLTKLSNLKVLSLVSLGLWGSLPAKINRFYALQVLNLSSNAIYGVIPPEISMITNLQSLVLANNLLNGSVPVVSKLSGLEELYLSMNRLGPEFPSLGKNLVTVVLKDNAFRSQLPSKLQNFDHLQHLDISSNQFSSSISSAWFSLPSIRYLSFAGNKLSGTLSTNISCSSGLVFLDLSHNYLTGKLPLCIGSNSPKRTMFYSWNCLSSGNVKYQHPNSFCHEKALAVVPATQGKKNGSTNKLILLLVTGAATIALCVTIGVILMVVYRRRKMRKAQIYVLNKSVSKRSSAQLSPKLPTEARHVSPTMRFGNIGLRTYRVFSLDEIEEATKNFMQSNLMGEGSQGQLYKGSLRDGSTVAVRCINLMQRHSPQRLLQHMEVLSKLRHQHLVSVLGHCIVTHQENPNVANSMYLIFEHVTNSTLRNHLTDRRKREMLKWPQRIAVTAGVAKGIQFLHTGIAPGIFGNNLKIENILLDQNLIAKISNYNLLIPTKLGSESPLSIAESPDNLGSSMPNDEHSEKEDVYHLGAIILEVITGKPIISQSVLDVQRLQLEQSLADTYATLRRVVDPSLHGSYAYESLRTVAEITLKCLSRDPVQRPTIEDVIWNLQYSVQVQDGWAISSEMLGAKSVSSGQ